MGVVETELRDKIRRLILELLEYSSYDPTGGVLTGPKYQTITLGDETVGGFRSDERLKLVEALDVRDDDFAIDLGANYGEVSRHLARRNPKARIQSFEYDRIFNTISKLINIYNSTTNIKVFDSDLTKEDFNFDFQYLIAFSVFRFIEGQLPVLAKNTGKLALIETHVVENAGIEDYYWQKLTCVYRHVVRIGSTDHGKGLSGARLFFVCANDAHYANEYIFRLARVLSGNESFLLEIELTKDSFGFYRLFSNSKFAPNAIEMLRSKLAGGDQYDAQLEDFKVVFSDHGFFAAEYWISYLLGCAQYVSSGDKLLDKNIYLQYMLKLLETDPQHESNYRNVLGDKEKLNEIITRRFRQLRKILTQANFSDVDPVILISDRSKGAALDFSVQDKSARLPISSMDGYHRVFAALVLGLERLKVLSVEVNSLA